MNKKLRAAAYCRVSTDKDEQANSLESQRHYFNEYIQSHSDWTLVDIFYDEGISGTQTSKRAGFNHMMDEAFHGNIDLILTKEVSRFARNTVDTLSYTRKLKEHGVGVIFTIDHIDTRDPDGEFRLTIMASIAQEESHKTSERVKWGQKRRMEQGIVFGRDLLGYTVKNGVLTINEEEAPIVRAIFHKYTNEGKGTHVIARELLEEGMRPKRISVWSNVVILRVLRNEKYAGDLCQKKTITPNYLTHKKKYNHGEEELVYIPNHHEPIIERDLWNRTQEELIRRSLSKEQKEKHSNRYWCSGKLYCGLCGKRFVSRTKRYKDGNTYKAWRCHAAAKHGRLKQDADGVDIGCENHSYNEKSLLAAVKYAIGFIQSNCDNLKEEILSEIKSVQSQPQEQINFLKIGQQIEQQIEAIREKKRKLLDLLLSDTISRQEMEEQNVWYDAKIEELEKQLFQYKQADQIRKRQTEEMEEYLKVLDEILNFDDTDDPVERQLLLQEQYYPEQLYKEVVDKIVLFPKGILQIYIKGLPFGIQMKIQSSGQRENYYTEVLEMGIAK